MDFDLRIRFHIFFVGEVPDVPSSYASLRSYHFVFVRNGPVVRCLWPEATSPLGFLHEHGVL